MVGKGGQLDEISVFFRFIFRMGTGKAFQRVGLATETAHNPVSVFYNYIYLNLWNGDIF